MQPTTSNRSYSEFFTSGFRAMTSRLPRQPSSTDTTTPMTLETSSMASSSRRNSFRNITNRRSRTTSMIGHSPSLKTDISSQRDRRSSVVSFSSWLFDHRKGCPSENSLTFSPAPQKNSRELHRSAEITEVWITAGGPYIPSNISRCTESVNTCDMTIDPFASSPDSKSFFTELSSDSPQPPRLKRESFLSFTPSPDRSFLHLPGRRERPTSIQTMPLPSHSRRSSYQYRPPSRDKSDYPWIITDLEETRASTPEPLADHAEWVDPAHGIDWRQFHVEILCEES